MTLRTALEANLRGVVARGYCHEENSGKELDGRLLEAIVEELIAAYPALLAAPEGGEGLPVKPDYQNNFHEGQEVWLEGKIHTANGTNEHFICVNVETDTGTVCSWHKPEQLRLRGIAAPTRDYITQLWEAAAEFVYISSHCFDNAMTSNVPTWLAAKAKLEALIKMCPKCGGEVSEKGGHGAWCVNPACKWGWETEMDGSPLKP